MVDKNSFTPMIIGYTSVLLGVSALISGFDGFKMAVMALIVGLVWMSSTIPIHKKFGTGWLIIYVFISFMFAFMFINNY